MTGAAAAPRMPALDALRGVLALFVCLGHGGQTFIAPVIDESADVSPIMVYGALSFALSRWAVLCFFVLSGFMIALSVQQNRLRHGTFSIRDYFLARAVRLLPPIAAAILFTWLLQRILHAAHWTTMPAGLHGDFTTFVTEPMAQVQAVLSLCMVGNLTGELNRPLWTLAYEIQLYVVVGLAMTALSSARSWRVRGAAAALLLAYVARVVVAATIDRVQLADNGLQLICSLGFAIGWLACRWQHRLPTALPGRLFGLGLVAAALAFAASMVLGKSDGPPDLQPTLLAAQISLLVAAAGLVLFLAPRAAPQALVRLGDFSYTLYVVHFPLLVFASFALFQFVAFYPPGVALLLTWCGVLLVVAVAKPLAMAVERPGAHRRWLERHLERLGAVTSARPR